MIDTQESSSKSKSCGTDLNVHVRKLGHCTRSTWDSFVLFGTGRLDELKSAAKKSKEKDIPEAFDFLFGIARIEGDQKFFEEMALDYTTQMGLSPPSWFDGHNKKKEVVDNGITFSVESFMVDTIIEATIKLENPRDLTIDLGNVGRIDASGIEIFFESLKSRLERKEKTKMVNGDKVVKGLYDRLKSVKGKPSEFLWGFCFTYCKLNGFKEMFDTLAMNYMQLGGENPEWVDLSEGESLGEKMVRYGDLTAPENIGEINEAFAKKFLESKESIDVKALGMITVDLSKTKSGSLTDAMNIAGFINVMKEQSILVSFVNVNEIVAAMLNTLAITNLLESMSLPGTI